MPHVHYLTLIPQLRCYDLSFLVAIVTVINNDSSSSSSSAGAIVGGVVAALLILVVILLVLILLALRYVTLMCGDVSVLGVLRESPEVSRVGFTQ